MYRECSEIDREHKISLKIVKMGNKGQIISILLSHVSKALQFFKSTYTITDKERLKELI